MKETSTNHHNGLAAGFFAFIFWGFAPIYFKLLEAVPVITIIAHRIIWSALLLLIYLAIRERKNLFSALKISKKRALYLLITGLLIVTNWLIFVWAVNHGQILATSLGYFITPLVNILFGLLFLKEKLTKPQIIALVIASASTLFFAVYTGVAPWIALALAVSFGLYGLLRKILNIRPMIGLFWETVLLIIPAIIYLYFYQIPETVEVDFRMQWLILSGLITLLPLIGFNYAANNLPLVWVGFIQYIAPSISFLIAVLLYGEDFSFPHKVTFSGIWLALLIVSIASLNNRRNTRKLKNSKQ